MFSRFVLIVVCPSPVVWFNNGGRRSVPDGARGCGGRVVCLGGGAKNPRSVRVTAPSNLSYTDFFWKVLRENVFWAFWKRFWANPSQGPGTRAAPGFLVGVLVKGICKSEKPENLLPSVFRFFL